MIYSVDNGDRGRVLVDGVEVERVLSLNTGSGEILKHSDPLRIENGEVVTETIFAKNAVFEPL